MTTQEMDRIEGEAAEWVLVLNEGSLADDTLAEWRNWIDASPHHRDTYEKMSNLWSMADNLPAEASSHQQVPDDLLSDVQNNVVPLPKRNTHWIWQSAAAAAVLVLSIFLLLPVKKEIPVLALTGLSALQTAHSEHTNYKLPDGSQVNLGANTKIQFAYDDQSRRITLVRGEAMFDVAKDPERPFIVSAGAGQYQALGTVFNVELLKNRSTLIVTEGIVQAGLNSSDQNYDGSNYPRLVAGESVSVSREGAIGDVKQVDLNVALTWQQGQLIFVDQPLSEVFERVNRYRQKSVVVSEELKAMRYTGSVRSDSIDDLLNILPEVFNVKVVHQSEAVYIFPI
ncbi:FecR domain-containing protein [Porticoccus sp. W117]|uniref:FecR family protein n=1 Tax=Porticoccus sp. W117 TaxID=3054777 RepID=UPI002596F8B6|nr:FecR domain-containing protein [Porticoccus sp. W117]MDM3869938.1 FecR domain-containing protein [Porticoccus sp. W117]